MLSVHCRVKSQGFTQNTEISKCCDGKRKSLTFLVFPQGSFPIFGLKNKVVSVYINILLNYKIIFFLLILQC